MKKEVLIFIAILIIIFSQQVYAEPHDWTFANGLTETLDESSRIEDVDDYFLSYVGIANGYWCRCLDDRVSHGYLDCTDEKNIYHVDEEENDKCTLSKIDFCYYFSGKNAAKILIDLLNSIPNEAIREIYFYDNGNLLFDYTWIDGNFKLQKLVLEFKLYELTPSESVITEIIIRRK